MKSSTTILLNHNQVAKVSDFGLSRIGPSDEKPKPYQYSGEGKFWLHVNK